MLVSSALQRDSQEDDDDTLLGARDTADKRTSWLEGNEAGMSVMSHWLMSESLRDKLTT